MGNRRTKLSTRRKEIETITVTFLLAIFAGQPFLLPEHPTHRQVLTPEVTSYVSGGCISSSSKEYLVFDYILIYFSLIAFCTSVWDLRLH